MQPATMRAPARTLQAVRSKSPEQVRINALNASKEFFRRHGVHESELERVHVTFETHDKQSAHVSWYVRRGTKGLEWLDVLSDVMGDDFSYTLKIYPTLGAEVTDI
ncbi:MAG: hypothetical protein KAT35_04975, partial [Candidatus Aenigmarchaeota archaeon]|nr:hypothetical protein [Candidatus Aenigmarchaeota archaeon]